jgi:hypothetical protein
MVIHSEGIHQMIELLHADTHLKTTPKEHYFVVVTQACINATSLIIWLDILA